MPYRHFALLAIIYAAAIVYVSLIIGPKGFHYVPLGFSHAWRIFVTTPFVDHDSGQRADWVANMLMLIPLAYLVNSAFQSVPDRLGGKWSAGLAFIVCLLFILTIKYAQLFFPPRTVTLNYIVAQSVGAIVGIVLFRLSHTRFYPALISRFENGDGLTILLGAYTIWLLIYFLMPFDFALSAGDLTLRFFALMDYLPSAPGLDNQPVRRALLILADTLAMAPVGMFLAVTGRRQPFQALLLRGFGLILIVTILTLFVLSAAPYVISIIYRTVGLGLGIWFMRKLRGKDLRKRHYYFSRYVPVTLPAYVLLVTFVSGVLSNQWVTADVAENALEPRQFLPFWNFYIVSKAHAAQSLVVVFLMFAPIGAMIWVRRGFWSRGAGFSAFVAFSLSMLMEIGRMMKPGLRPDFTDPIIAAAAAAIAFKAMPTLWRMFEQEAKMSGSLDSYIAERRQPLPDGERDAPAAEPEAVQPQAITI